MKEIRRWIAAAAVLVAGLGLAFSIKTTNDRYRPGDWVSYGVSSYISSVAVGPQYAYFGSTSGILRYEIIRGNWEPPYTTSDGLASNAITSVGFDRFTGTLWCATEAGISRLHPASLEWTNFSKTEIGILPSEEIVSIGFDDRTNWFETATRRFRQDKFGDIFIPDNGVTDDSTIQWFGHRAPRPRRLPQFFMPEGYLFDPSSGAVQDNHLRRAPVTDVIKDEWGNMWLGTWGLGALRGDLNVDRAELLRFGLANQRVDALLLGENGIWIGGRHVSFATPFRDDTQQGITVWSNPYDRSSRSRDWQYYDARNNLDMSSDEVNEFVADQGKLYCATEYGINVFDQKKERWRRILPADGLADERVNDVLVLDRYLYAATDLGLNKISIETIGRDSLGISEIATDELRHVRIYDLEAQQNLIWIGTERGPYIYDTARQKGGYLADNEGPRDLETFAISFSDSVVWIGTQDGVEAFDVKHKQWLGAPARRRFPSTRINCILAGPDVVWVGTSQGLFKYHRTKQDWHQYTEDDGLVDNEVNAVRLDEELVWVGTDEGLTVFRWRAFHDID